MHRLILHNDEIRNASELCIAPGQIGYMTGWGVFSTLRVSRGVLFAFERHWARMKRDAELLRVPMPANGDWLEERLMKLVEANEAYEATLRVNLVRNRGGMFEGPELEREYDLIAFTTDLKKWGESVKLGVVPQARHAANRYAGTKVTSWVFNLNLYEEAQQMGFDEVVLLNERGEVSECTSANIFVVIGSDVLTPPLSSGCLAGITREVLLSEIRLPWILISEQVLTTADLQIADEVFITSSTRDVLPVNSIHGLDINRNDRVWPQLRGAFRSYIETYVGSKVRA
ncbi:MAG: aminotransferase class IV [Bryobacteraceae bacterium]